VVAMGEEDYVDLWSVQPPRRLPFNQVLPLAGRILEDRSFRGRVDVSSWDDESLLAYWALRYVGASRLPLREGYHSLEDLGFYEFPEYPSMSIARDPLQLALAGRPTPVVRAVLYGGVEAWFKLEWYNPYSLSIKDRVAWYMVWDALRGGGLGRGVVEASSSNTGIALSAIASVLGVKARVYLPRTAPVENIRILRLLGAEVGFTDSLVTTEIAGLAREDAAREGMVHLDQFGNDANLEVHLRYTAREYYLQLEEAGSSPGVLVVASGTSGTASALMFVFSRFFPGLRVHVVVPRQGEVIEGIRRLETGVKWLDAVGVEYSIVEVGRREALEGMKELARRAGIIPGVSGGAVVAAIGRLLRDGVLGRGEVVAGLIPDSGFKYPRAVAEAVGEDGF